jgi:hypothetical protein
MGEVLLDIMQDRFAVSTANGHANGVKSNGTSNGYNH